MRRKGIPANGSGNEKEDIRSAQAPKTRSNEPTEKKKIRKTPQGHANSRKGVTPPLPLPPEEHLRLSAPAGERGNVCPEGTMASNILANGNWSWKFAYPSLRHPHCPTCPRVLDPGSLTSSLTGRVSLKAPNQDYRTPILPRSSQKDI